MPVSPNLGIVHLDANAAQPEVVVDAAIDALDAKITKQVSIGIGTSNAAVLTQSQQAGGSLFVIADNSPGSTGNIAITFASFGMGLFSVYNATNHPATLKYAGQSGPLPVIGAGQRGLFSGDSAQITAVGTSSAGASTFTALTDCPSSYSAQALKGVRVNPGATGLEFHAPLFTDLADAPSSYTSQALKAVRVNAGATALEFYTPSSGGATAFTGLSDVPASYSGAAGKFVKVNAGATGLEFDTGGGTVADFTDLADVPATYSGAALKVVRVNAGATGLEFHAPAFTDLSDVPSSYSGQTLKAVRVNAGETALEFYTPSGGGGYSAGTPPTIVQSGVDNSGSQGVTLGSPPTNGNMLVAHCFNPTVSTIGSGWTQIAIVSTGTDFGIIIAKMAGAGESATQNPLGSAPGTGVIVIWELNGPTALTSIISGATQAEASGILNVPIPLQIYQDSIFLGSVSVVTGANISSSHNLGNQDQLIASSGNRRIVAGHATLADLPWGGIVTKLSTSGATKGASCVVLNV